MYLRREGASGWWNLKCWPVNDVFPEFPNTTLHACWKINRDHLARLVFFIWEDFAYNSCIYKNEKKTILLYRGEFRVPPRVLGSRPEPCGAKRFRMEKMWINFTRNSIRNQKWLALCIFSSLFQGFLPGLHVWSLEEDPQWFPQTSQETSPPGYQADQRTNHHQSF